MAISQRFVKLGDASTFFSSISRAKNPCEERAGVEVEVEGGDGEEEEGVGVEEEEEDREETGADFLSGPCGMPARGPGARARGRAGRCAAAASTPSRVCLCLTMRSGNGWPFPRVHTVEGHGSGKEEGGGIEEVPKAPIYYK